MNKKIKNKDWITIFEFNIDEINGKTNKIYGVMVDPEYCKSEFFNTYEWGFDFNENLPFLDKKALTKINEYSNFEPIIYTRNKEIGYKLDISQELILLYDLNFKNNIYTYYDYDNEVEIEVIKIEQNKVEIRKSFLMKYLTAKQKNLIIGYISGEKKNNIVSKPNIIEKGTNYIYNRYIIDLIKNPNKFKSESIIVGKVFIKCQNYTIKNTNLINNKYEEYIIDGDEVNPIFASCNPNKLNNHYNDRPNELDPLTPIFFKKEVMNKYYNKPDTYFVHDGYVEKKGFWTLTVDNNNKDYVSIFIEDINKITNKEQKYWAFYNIPPKENKISQTNMKRSFFGDFSDPECPCLIFKDNFNSLNEKWKNKKGDFLFLELKQEDKHYFDSLHSLSSNEQKELDDLIFSLAKITNDSLNLKNLKLILPDSSFAKEGKSVNLFGEILKNLNIQKEDIEVIFELQAMRSSSTAHRKGKQYYKNIKKYNMDLNNKKYYFDKLLERLSFLFKEIEKRL